MTKNNANKKQRANKKSTASASTSSPSVSSYAPLKHKVRAMVGGDKTVVKTIISHPMETGFRKNKKTGKAIPAHFINEIVVKHNNKVVLIAYWGPAISKDPLLHFTFNGGVVGDKIDFYWSDNRGGKGSFSTTVI